MDIAKVKAAMLRKKKPESPVQSKDLLSSGSTLLNLACSGRSRGAFPKGKYIFFVGDSASGKTFLALTCLAEASVNSNFENYRLIYDNAEDGALMDMGFFFGDRVAERLEPPAEDDHGPVYSNTIEEFYYNLDDAIRGGQPFIYILDSMDSLSSEEESAKFEEKKEAFRKGKESAGVMTDGKAKKNSANLRKMMKGLRKTGSILIIINQTRDNLGFGFEKKTRSGGRSLRFYASIEIWTSIKEKTHKIVKKKKRQIGVVCEVQIKKNRLTGKERSVEVPIFHSFGIDDIGSCVDYLVSEGHWPNRKGTIVAEDFAFQGSRDKLIRKIELEGLERDLQALVAEVWQEIEEECAVHRKRRY